MEICRVPEMVCCINYINFITSDDRRMHKFNEFGPVVLCPSCSFINGLCNKAVSSSYLCLDVKLGLPHLRQSKERSRVSEKVLKEIYIRNRREST